MTALSECLKEIVPQDDSWRDRAMDHIHDLTMPRWALGRILEIAVDLAGMTRTLDLQTKRKTVVLFAGDHGVVAQGVSPQPQSVTVQMLKNFSRGGGAISVLASSVGADVKLIDIGVNADTSDIPNVLNRKIAYGTRDMYLGPAMTRAEAVRSLEIGIEAAELFAGNTDVFATGEMGIGNTTPSSAIVTVLSREIDPLAYVGRGAGLEPERLVHKAAVIKHAIELNEPNPEDPIDILSKVGGFEIGGIAGVILGAAKLKKPVVIDGFISTAGALIAHALAPESADYMILAHSSVERGHVRMAEILGKKALLNLELRLGEGTGAALAMPFLDAASAIMREMSTFSSAGVTEEGL